MRTRGVLIFFVAAFVLNVVYVLLWPHLPRVMDPRHPSCPDWVCIAVQAGILGLSAALGALGALAPGRGKRRR